MKIRKGMRFGAWKVLDSEPYYYEHHKKAEPFYQCVDVVNGKQKLVRKWHLTSGYTQGSKESREERIKLGMLNDWKRGGHSTRVKNKHLPMYVHPWEGPGKIKYRYLKKENGKVITHKYFRTLKQAKFYAENV